MPGHPDWQSVPQQTLTPVVSKFSSSMPVGFTLLYSGAASSWASLICRLTAATGAARVIFNWYADQALTQIMGRDTFLINNNTGAAFRYPVQGPYLAVQLFNDLTVAQVMTLWVQPTQTPVDGIRYTVEAQQAGADSVTYTPSQTVNYFPGFLSRGFATLAANPFDTAGELTFVVFSTDQFGANVRRLAYLPGIKAFTTVNFAVPDQPLKLEVVNVDAVASHEADVSLVIPGQ